MTTPDHPPARAAYNLNEESPVHLRSRIERGKRENTANIMKNFKREIFEQLGNLFYTLAVDQEVPPMASGELKMLLKKDWLTEPQYISEDKVSEAAHIIGLTIDSLQATKTPPRQVFSAFSAFYTEHEEQFSAALKQKVIDSAEAITKIFPTGKTNAHLEELKMLFSQTPQSSEVPG